MKTPNQEVMLSLRVTTKLLQDIERMSRNKYSSRSHFIRDVLQKAIDKTK
jgi:metal-responsive CopG/Arc/MetJ family transcriptional regulator